MELIITKEDNGLYLVVVKSAKGRTLRKFFTLNVDHIGSLEQDELEQEVKDGLI